MIILNQYLQKVSVIGAGGKMGAGIALLLLILMAEEQNGRLVAVDVSEIALSGLKKYLKQQLLRHAEKNINRLRTLYANDPKLVSNEEIIDAFVCQAFERVDFTLHLEDVRGSLAIFEAAVEDIASKTAIFESIKAINGNKAWIFTNTSSIPIALLNDRAKMENRIIGFHFYNPPLVQKLVEIIELPQNPDELKQIAKDLGKSLHKTMVYSRDIAGFIGNGYFIREILYTFQKWDKSDLGLQRIETVTKDFLLRPMGIFQLIDYVGLDVVRNILAIMRMALPDDSFNTDGIDAWLALGIKGGQTFDGQQKNGIFEYVKGKPSAFFSLTQKKYVPLAKDLQIGEPPLGLTWHKEPLGKERLDEYFTALAAEKTPGAKLAKDYLHEGKKIADKLLKDRVASSIEDIATVLKTGFYHLYGPRNEF